jgi:efflux transporter, RND family, MFP subunit
MNKYLLITSSIALIACNEQQQKQEEKIISYPVITVSQKDIISELSFPVNIEGVVNSPVQAKISGYITQVLVDEGQSVKQGQPMFRLETQALNQSAQSAKASVEAAQVEVNKLIPLVEKNIVSKIQLETAQANLQRAKAAYNEVAANIDYSVVKAPVNGVVGEINYREGALVTANSTVLTTVSDIKDVYTYFSMNEKEYLNFLENTEGKNIAEKLNNIPKVSLRLANGHEYEHKGKIQAVTGQIDTNTGSIQFRAIFPNPDKVLNNGNSGTIVIPEEHKNSIVIPEVATFEQQGKIFTYKVENNTIKQAVITIRERSNNYIVVENGLKAGDVIIVQGLNAVRTGMVIQPKLVNMDSLVNAIKPIF